jgi:peptidoglycan/LPS O-acetylase OafA/YrhL
MQVGSPEMRTLVMVVALLLAIVALYDLVLGYDASPDSPRFRGADQCALCASYLAVLGSLLVYVTPRTAVALLVAAGALGLAAGYGGYDHQATYGAVYLVLAALSVVDRRADRRRAASGRPPRRSAPAWTNPAPPLAPCPHCGHPNAIGRRFCGGCGLRLATD